MADRKLNGKPKKARAHHNVREAWYYENPGSIDVVVEVADHNGNYLGTGTVRIMRRELFDWIERTS
jgi:hypothetical protein